MSDEPPELNHVAPRWFHDRWEKMVASVIANRPVAGVGVTVVDAPGGGKMISADSSGISGGTEGVYVAVNGQIYFAQIVMTLGEPS